MEDQQYVSYSPDVAQDSNPPAEPAAPVERQPDSEEGKLFIGNLSYATAAADLENEFGRYGAIASARVIVDHATERSRGFGFVTFVDPACALDALAMNDQEFMGRIIKVNQSTPKAPRSEGDRRRGDGEGRREYDRGYVDRGGYGDRRDDRTREPRRDDRGGGQPYPTDRGYGDRGYADRGHADRGGYGSTGAGRDRGGYDRRDDRGYGDRGIDVRGGAGGYDRGYGGDRGYGHDRGGSAGAGYANDRGGYGADRGGYAGSRGYADRGAGYHAPVERGGRDRSQDRGVGGGYATGGARGGGYGGDRNGGGGYGDRNGSGGGYGERGGYDRGGPYGARGGGDDRGYSGGGGYGDRGGYPGGDRGSNERGYGGGGGGRGVCFSWQKGTCKYGDSCRFVHEGPAGGGGAAPSQHAAY